MRMNRNEMNRLLSIGIALSKEKDTNHLFMMILDTAMDIANCDGGTLYDMGEDELVFRMMETRSMNIRSGMNGDKIPLPPVKLRRENVCCFAAIDRSVIRIDDVYDDTRFNFSGPKNYDRQTGYHTQSMLVIPMENDYGEIIGVLQLINALGEDGEIVPFRNSVMQVLQSLASLVAIRMTTLNYNEELRQTLASFVRVMSTAIDARSPYNASHTKNMERYAEHFLDWMVETNHPRLPEKKKRQELLMAVWLHDIGKLVIPIEIMDKETRLGSQLQAVKERFRVMKLLNQLRCSRGEIRQEVCTEQEQKIVSAWELIQEVNCVGFVTDEMIEDIRKIGEERFTDEFGEIQPFLTDSELECLMIRKGTLTDKERETMNNHVTMTSKMLEQMQFSRDYPHVREWAGMHHEFLDGSGYPKHLREDEIPYEVRILTILDIFDALTARDRPYRKCMPTEKAIQVLYSMVEEGKLDGTLVADFACSRAWERTNVAKERLLSADVVEQKKDETQES